MGNTMGHTGNLLLGQNRLQSANSSTGIQGQLNPKSILRSSQNKPQTLSQLNNQFLTFKLDTPKIVTIKK